MAEPNELVSAEVEGDESVASEAKGNGLFLILLLPLMLLSAGGGAWLAYAQYPALASIGRSMFPPEDPNAVKPVEYGEFLELANIVVNPSDTEGRRLLMISIGFESLDAHTLEDLTAREMVVRDTIIKILGQRTVEELAAIDQRTPLKNELRTAVNGILPAGQIDRMYFTQYVLQ